MNQETTTSIGEIKDRFNFLAYASAVSIAIVTMAAIALYTITVMVASVFSEDVAAPHQPPPVVPACSAERTPALQAAINQCIDDQTSDGHARCIDTVQRAICAEPAPPEPKPVAHKRYRTAAEAQEAWFQRKKETHRHTAEVSGPFWPFAEAPHPDK